MSLLILHTKTKPKKVDMCIKNDSTAVAPKEVAIVEYPSEREAFIATDRVKRSAFGRKWDVKIIKNPAFSAPEQEVLNQWLR